MKRRIIAASACFLVFLLFSAAAAANLELLLTQGRAACTLQPGLILTQLLRSRRALLMTLLLAAVGLLCVLWALFGNSYLNYRSSMYQVVPGFKIPQPEGQGQFGTAWWLDPHDYGKCFSSVSTPKNLPLTAELTEQYTSERSRIEHGEL